MLLCYLHIIATSLIAIYLRIRRRRDRYLATHIPPYRHIDIVDAMRHRIPPPAPYAATPRRLSYAEHMTTTALVLLLARILRYEDIDLYHLPPVYRYAEVAGSVD
jgi:hypothetical protein